MGIRHRQSSYLCAYYLRAYKAPRPSTSVENIRQIRLFLQNKANFDFAVIHLSPFITSKYVKVDNWLNQTNKANSKPIQTQFKPKQSQFKPNCQKPKNERKNCYNKEL